jgi:hypothetical protein
MRASDGSRPRATPPRSYYPCDAAARAVRHAARPAVKCERPPRAHVYGGLLPMGPRRVPGGAVAGRSNDAPAPHGRSQRSCSTVIAARRSGRVRLTVAARRTEGQPHVRGLSRPGPVAHAQALCGRPPQALVGDALDAGEAQSPGHRGRLLVAQLGQPRLVVVEPAQRDGRRRATALERLRCPRASSSVRRAQPFDASRARVTPFRRRRLLFCLVHSASAGPPIGGGFPPDTARHRQAVAPRRLLRRTAPPVRGGIRAGAGVNGARRRRRAAWLRSTRCGSPVRRRGASCR